MKAKALVLVLALCGVAAAQQRTIALRCGTLIDTRAGRTVSNAVIVVSGDRITSAGANIAVPAGAEVIDLSRKTCLPGLIDNHTHVLLQGDITAADYDEQLLKQSIPYRTIAATANA